MRHITILGSTGSIGVQTLEVVDELGNIKVEGITTHLRIDLAEKQVRKYKPDKVCVSDEAKAKDLAVRIGDTNTKVLSGEDGLVEIAAGPKSDTVVTGIVGIAGLKPTISAIHAKKRIALANKETLVTAGDIVIGLADEKKVEIIPVDSEHSAIFQCLQNVASPDGYQNEIKRIILTASGGPFFGRDRKSLEGVTKEQALKHPNWDMGTKITIDSATLMNKGLEVLEAAHLFRVSLDQVAVMVHRQSIIHSMVEFVDNGVLAQLGKPDMKLPIQYAITFPHRKPMKGNELNLLTCGDLTFAPPDKETFRCLDLAYQAGHIGGTMPCVMNGANEMAVALFLQDKIDFLQIADIIEAAMQAHFVIKKPSLEDILQADRWAREYVQTQLDII